MESRRQTYRASFYLSYEFKPLDMNSAQAFDFSVGDGCNLMKRGKPAGGGGRSDSLFYARRPFSPSSHRPDRLDRIDI
jgi:hypothetical protein